MTAYHFPDQTGFYKGKVRDVYSLNNGLLIMIASDRISAFDVILPRLIPYKGQVLNQIAAFMLKATHDICPNWLLSVPAPPGEHWKKMRSVPRRNGDQREFNGTCLENLFFRPTSFMRCDHARRIKRK
ncbi:MAG: phosphoribosylaminoimidazolesuccinocarboxamide synthase [Puia sp.]